MTGPKSDQTIVVTGASSGIGRELARSLAPRASRLVLVARREASLNELADEVARDGLQVDVQPCDLGDRASRAQLLATLRDLPVDMIVSAAGAGSTGFYDEQPVETIEGLIELNLIAAMEVVHAVLPQMIQRRSGSILVIGSGSGAWPIPGQTVYAASKFGLHGFCETLRLDLEGTGIQVTESMPGPVDTEFDASAGLEGGMDSPVARTRISAEQCVRDTLRGLDAGAAIVYPGRAYNALMRFGDMMPRPLTRRMAGQQARPRPLS